MSFSYVFFSEKTFNTTTKIYLVKYLLPRHNSTVVFNCFFFYLKKRRVCSRLYTCPNAIDFAPSTSQSSKRDGRLTMCSLNATLTLRFLLPARPAGLQCMHWSVYQFQCKCYENIITKIDMYSVDIFIT